MSTAAILIGNSDDKLTQEEWSTYATEVQDLIDRKGYQIYFFGYPSTLAKWQNACWVIDIPKGPSIDNLTVELARLAGKYRQDSIALLVGNTEFVKGRA